MSDLNIRIRERRIEQQKASMIDYYEMLQVWLGDEL